MKKLKSLAILAIFFIAMFVVPGAYANPINVNNWVKVYDVPNQGNTSGGEFALKSSSTQNGTYTYQFNTFCLETDEYLNYGEALKVSNISKTAWLGGSNTNAGDPLDKRTAYLFYHFIIRDLDTLTSGAYSETGDAGANALQKAIWYIEQESGGANNYLVTLANGASQANLDYAYNRVSVLNLVHADGSNAQDLLTIVPEPATMLLLGLGLFGIGIASRRKKL